MAKIFVNFASPEELKLIPGVGNKTADAIVAIRQDHGNITPILLTGIMRKSISPEVMACLDFTPNTEYFGGREEEDVEENLGEELVKSQIKKQIENTLWPHREGHTEPSKMGAYGGAEAASGSSSVTTSKKTTAAMAGVKELRSRSKSRASKRETEKKSKRRLQLGDISPAEEEMTELCPPKGKEKKTKKTDVTKQTPNKTPVPRGTKLPKESELQDSSEDSSEEDEDEDEDSEDSEEGLSLHTAKSVFRRKGGIPALKSLPKTLQYDGKTKWLPFKHKFTRYAEVCQWSAAECLDCLIWCLTGKASDFCATLMQRSEHLSYRKLLSRLEERFGDRELPAAAQVRFQNALQKKDETLEDWADRVLELAGKAFKEVPEKYSNQQAITRFCQGLQDLDAGHHVAMQRPKTMDDAMNEVRLYQHTKEAMYGRKSGRSRVTRVTAEDYEDDVPQVCSVAEKPQYSTPSTVEKAIVKLQEDMAKFFRNLEKMQPGSQPQTASGGQKSTKAETRRCYNCQEIGHLIKNCPHPKKRDLNKSGTSQGTGARTQPRQGPKDGSQRQ